MGHEDVSILFKLHRIKERIGKDIIRGNLNSDTRGTEGESRNDSCKYYHCCRFETSY